MGASPSFSDRYKIMRKDMSKVLVTTARIGHSLKNDDVRSFRREKLTEESEPLSKLGMKPKLKKWSERKQLNEYLNPLIRFLKTNCGRPWNLVYSEIKKANPNGSAVTEHIYQHLFDFVELRPSYEGHDICSEEGQKLYPPYNYYVNAAGILLEANQSRDKRIRPPLKDTIKVSDTVYLIKRQTDNVWFMIHYTKIILGTHTYANGVVSNYTVTPNFVQIEDLVLPKVQEMYPNFSKTLSKKEKKKYKIN
jgi:hypothetical protein